MKLKRTYLTSELGLALRAGQNGGNTPFTVLTSCFLK